MIARHLILWLLCLAAAIVSLAWQFVAIFTAKRRAVRIAVGFDQTANAAFGGDEDETISSRAAKARLKGKRWGCALCRFLDWLDPNHCTHSIEPDEGEKISE